MIPRISVFLIFLWSHTTLTYGQQCGTRVTKEQVEFERSQHDAMRTAGSVKPVHCLNKTLSIVVHIVMDSLNNGNVTQTEIDDALAEVNKDFEPICLQFAICKEDTIRNFQFDSIADPVETSEISHLYDVPDMINVYLISALYVAGSSETRGMASFTGNWVLVCKHDPLTSKKTWSHEMGHFFSLYHTFEVAFGAELVDGSNCATAGDLLCDTEADIENPYIVLASATQGLCTYMDLTTDAIGNQYTPIIGNIMSYHPPECKSRFTVQQLDRMSAYYLSYRNYLH